MIITTALIVSTSLGPVIHSTISTSTLVTSQSIPSIVTAVFSIEWNPLPVCCICHDRFFSILTKKCKKLYQKQVFCKYKYVAFALCSFLLLQFTYLYKNTCFYTILTFFIKIKKNCC